ncbi:MAG: hypothetical protein P4L90_12800 [Rhodopila sp.]|nr:hypothetical protein [Rhodopila sp.]
MPRIGLNRCFMYIAIVPNRGSPRAVLLRKSYCEDGKLKNRTPANLSGQPVDRIEIVRAAFRGDKLVAACDNDFEIRRSLPHGHVLTALTIAWRTGL